MFSCDYRHELFSCDEIFFEIEKCLKCLKNTLKIEITFPHYLKKKNTYFAHPKKEKGDCCLSGKKKKNRLQDFQRKHKTFEIIGFF